MPSKTTARKTAASKTTSRKTTTRKTTPRKTMAPVREEDIALKAKKTDLTRLKRYVKEQGRAAVPFLQRALDEGNWLMRQAAVEHLFALDLAPTERRLLKQLAAIGRKKGADAELERDELLQLLLWLGTSTSVDTFVREGGKVEDSVPERVLEQLVEHASGAVGALSEQDALELLKRLWLVSGGRLTTNPPLRGASARRLARTLLDHASMKLRQMGSELSLGVEGLGALADLRQRGIPPPVEIVQELCRQASAEQQFEALSPQVTAEGGPALLAQALRAPYDPRWGPLLEPHLDEEELAPLLQAMRHPEALRRLRARAETPPFYGDAQRACYELGQAGDPAAAPILMRWMRDPHARGASPMLLTALAACGDASLIPELKELKKTEPTRGGFYDSTIAELRERG